MSITRRTFACLAAATLTQSPALAQEWPGKQPIRIIVPYPAGGNGDSGARAYAGIISANLKQAVIIETRPGASSIIGSEVVAKASPDGYTDAEFNAAAKLPSMKEKLGSSDDPYPATSAELRARLARDIDAYGAVIRATIK
jgi:tripartite-type tricarboxylate transporter receptor subunit TctC